MNFPAELKYSKSHEWIKLLDDTTALVGITDFAQGELGDLVFINLPIVGDAVTKEEAFCDVESVKAVSDVMSPVTGVVAEVNEALLDAPEQLNEAPYDAWIAKIDQITDQEELMDAAAFEELSGLMADCILRGKEVGDEVAKLRGKYQEMRYCFSDSEVEAALENLAKTTGV